MDHQLGVTTGKQFYGQLKQTVEPVFGMKRQKA